MIKVSNNLFIGSEVDYEGIVKREGGWHVVHACKEPYHRKLLGYTGRAAPKTHPEYLVAVRGDRLFLNLIDAADPAYIPKEIIDAALGFVDTALQSGGRVLVHCNQGESRSPSIGLLYLAVHTKLLPITSLAHAEAEFRKLYPSYNPKGGMRGFLLKYWDHYTQNNRGEA